MTEPDQHPEPGPKAGIDEIQADIERTRNQLGETVAALSSKVDVKQKVKQKATHSKELVAQKAHAAPAVPLGLVAAVAVLLGIVIWKRRH